MRRDFVQEGEREAQDLGGKVSRKVDEVTDSDLGAEVERGAEKAGSELEKASNSAQVPWSLPVDVQRQNGERTNSKLQCGCDAEGQPKRREYCTADSSCMTFKQGAREK